MSMRPIALAALSVNHIAPSGPAQIIAGNPRREHVAADPATWSVARVPDRAIGSDGDAVGLDRRDLAQLARDAQAPDPVLRA